MMVRLTRETKAKPDELAEHMGRTRPLLTGEAIADHVERERAAVAGTGRGLGDMQAGRVTPHEAAACQIKETIDRAQKGR